MDMRRQWIKNESDIAKAMLQTGKSYDEIAISLKRTKRSVRLHLNRSGLQFKDFHSTTGIRKCVQCSSEFNSKLSEGKIFCNRSCAAVFNQTLIIQNGIRYRRVATLNSDGTCAIALRHVDDLTKCTNDSCDNSIGRGKKYCSHRCNQAHKTVLRNLEIENGNVSFPANAYRKYLMEKYGCKCMECGWSKVNPTSGRIPVELEHIDGNSSNNSLSNLKLLCPNCHSLTPTYKALNKGNGRHARMERFKNGKSF